MREETKEARSAPGTADPWEVVQVGGPQNCEWKQEGWCVLSMHTSGTGEGLQGRAKQCPWADSSSREGFSCELAPGESPRN